MLQHVVFAFCGLGSKTYPEFQNQESDRSINMKMTILTQVIHFSKILILYFHSLEIIIINNYAQSFQAAY